MTTLSFNSNMISAFLPKNKKDEDEVSLDKIQKILGQNKNGEKELPPIRQYNEKDIKELEEFCQKFGVISANFGNIDPKIALRMLKAKMGVYEEKPIIKEEHKKLLYD